jgi:hypothetical protein
MRARLTIDHVGYDIAVIDSETERFWDIAKEARVVPVRLEATWAVRSDGTYELDPARTRVVGVDTKWTPSSGVDTVQALRAAAGDAFADLDEVHEMLGIDRKDAH